MLRHRLLFAAAFAAALCATASRAGPVIEAWKRGYDGPSAGSDYAVGVAVDAAGDVAVVGRSAGTGTDFYTAKYAAADGALLWEKRFTSASNDVPWAIACDAAGNVVVTGYAGTVPASDYYTAKYAAADGTLLWSRIYNGTGNGLDRAQALALDAGGNAVVTGLSSNGSNSDYYTAKYAAADGAILWERRYNGPASNVDSAEAVAVDAAGNVTVTGTSSNGVNQDFYTARYAAADGALLWEKRYNGTGNDIDAGHDVAVDAAGNAIVTGYSKGASSANQDFYTAKYAAADGALVWERRYDSGLGTQFDEAWAVKVDAVGDVIVTGGSDGPSSASADFYTAKYAGANGAVLWERRYNGPGSSSDKGCALALDAAGNAFVTGSARNAAGDDDFYTAKYAAADGALVWEKTYDGPGHYHESFAIIPPTHGKIAATPDGGAVIAGSSSLTNFPANYDLTTIQYSPQNAPLVATGNAASIATTSATLHATANPRRAAASAWLEYGPTAAYGTGTTPQALGSGFGNIPASAAAGALQPGTLYHFRCVAQNALGVSYGADATFTTAPLDTDGDGIPDAWEAANGLDAGNPADALQDSDGDSAPNLAEFIAGTDPQSAASVLRAEVVPGVAGGFRVRFTAQAGRAYTVQFTASIGPASWQKLADVAAQPAAYAAEVADAPGAQPVRFYRVVTPVQP